MDNGFGYGTYWTGQGLLRLDKELNELTRITQEQENITQANVKTSKTQSYNEAQIEIAINS